MNTTITALGTGAAFTMKGKQTNFLVNRNGKNLLIDCGSDIRWSLQDFNLSFKNIDAIYISHLHGDHCGGMEYIGFARYFTKKGMEAAAKQQSSNSSNIIEPMRLSELYCERGIMKNLWEHVLQGGMECLEGIECKLDTYFNLNPIKKNGSFNWEGLDFNIVQSLHISSKYSIVDSFGLMFTDDNNQRIYITTDIQFLPINSLKAYYTESDIIIHDCETMYKSGVHAHYDDLKTLPVEIKSKLRLTHYQDNVLENWDEWSQKAHDDGFFGFVKPGLIYQTNI